MQELSQAEQTVVNRMREMAKSRAWGEVRIEFQEGKPTFAITQTKEKVQN